MECIKSNRCIRLATKANPFDNYLVNTGSASAKKNRLDENGVRHQLETSLKRLQVIKSILYYIIKCLLHYVIP